MNDRGLPTAELLAKIRSLQLKTEVVVDGVLGGLHKSPQHGSSIEFAEHKEYSQGDEVRHIDWKAYGRLDRYYVKKFEDETNLRAYLVVDGSGSMGYGGEGSVVKLDHASVLAAALCYILIRQQDSPSLLTFAEKIRSYLPPRSVSGHFEEISRDLAKLAPTGETNLAGPIEFLVETLRGRNLVIIFSDLFDHANDVVKLLARLRARRNDVVVFHTLHPDELRFNFEHLTQFEDMESDDRVLADPEAIRREYLTQFLGWADALGRSLQDQGVEYVRVDISVPPENTLLAFLRTRGAKR